MTAPLLWLIAGVGLLLTTIQTLLTILFRRRLRPFPGALPFRPGGSFVSILKPVCGLDDELEENLISFTTLGGIDYEVIVSAEEWTDPAVEVVRRVMRMYPAAPFRLVVESGSTGKVVNRKVERLITAMSRARGDLIFISDSNVRVLPDDFARTVELFADPSVGCVSNLFTGSGAEDLGAALESLHLLSFVIPGAVLAAVAGVPCVVGKSMVIRRSVLSDIGGFERFRTILAEDQAIALAIRAAGRRVVLSPVAVRNVIVKRSVHRAAERQIRWNKIRFSFSRDLYGAEILLNPLPFAVVAAGLDPAWSLPLLLVVFVRVGQAALLRRAIGEPVRLGEVFLMPALDLLMAVTWLVPFFSNSVTWRGYRARIGRNTEMIQVAA